MTSVEKQFHLPPFPPFPSAERYIRVGSQDDALQRVRRAVEAWEAISLVIGPPGTGKSLICQVLQKHFAREREVIVFGDATLESPQALQRHLLNRLDRIRGIAATPAAAGDDPQLAIIERIAASSKEFAGLLLLVDEAQTLRPEVLETIRILTNVMSGGRPRVSAVLLGGPRLDETLALPSLDALVQRVATRCYLHPLSSDETVHYVREAIKRCADTIRLEIDESAIRSIHRACSGVPRLVNQLMTASLAFASQRKQSRVTDQTVDQAWSVLQQLPSPLIDEPEVSRPGYEVEFGPLSDDLDRSRSETSASQIGILEAEPEETPAEFTMQTEVVASCDELSFEPMSYDCGSLESFDYDACEKVGCVVGRENALQDETAMPDELAIDTEFESPELSGTPSLNELFGEFEEEESVRESLAGQSDSGFPPSSLRLGPTADDHEDTEPSDLESSLHREILSLRGVAAAPVLWMDDAEAAGEAVDDDRDLLIIEDDVPIEEAVIAAEASSEEPGGTPLAVDFQSMLAKMRSPRR